MNYWNELLRHARAEMLLTYLYPGTEQQWTARHEGNFSRNYAADLLSLDPEQLQVSLSRDGLLKLLPQGLISPEHELQDKDAQERQEEMLRRKQLLEDTFLPFDTLLFRERLAVEKEAADILHERDAYVLRHYYGYDIETEQSPYVRQLARLLFQVRYRRGDLSYIRRMLEQVLGHPVRLVTGRHSHTDTTRRWVPLIRMEVEMKHLSQEAYLRQCEELQPVGAFIREWFIPFEAEFQLEIHQSPTPDGVQLLDYDTVLNT